MGAVGGGFVFIAAEVQYAVGEHAQEFLLKGHSVVGGILAHALYGDVDIAMEGITLAVIKGDDVGKGVVGEVLHIDAVEVVVVAKDVVNGTYFAVFRSGDSLYPTLEGVFFIRQGEVGFVKKANHKALFLCFIGADAQEAVEW